MPYTYSKLKKKEEKEVLFPTQFRCVFLSKHNINLKYNGKINCSNLDSSSEPELNYTLFRKHGKDDDEISFLRIMFDS